MMQKLAPTHCSVRQATKFDDFDHIVCGKFDSIPAADEAMRHMVETGGHILECRLYVL